MIDFKTALAVAEKIASITADCIRIRGREIEFTTHILPLIQEHYKIPKKVNPELLMMVLMSNLAGELESCGEEILTEIGHSVVSLRMAGLILLAEHKFDFEVRKDMVEA